MHDDRLAARHAEFEVEEIAGEDRFIRRTQIECDNIEESTHWSFGENEDRASEVLKKVVEPKFASLEEALEAGRACKKCNHPGRHQRLQSLHGRVVRGGCRECEANEIEVEGRNYSVAMKHAIALYPRLPRLSLEYMAMQELMLRVNARYSCEGECWGD